MVVDFVAGEHDSKFRTLHERAAALVPRSRLWTAEGAYHDVTLHDPSFVADVIATPSREECLHVGAP